MKSSVGFNADGRRGSPDSGRRRNELDDADGDPLWLDLATSNPRDCSPRHSRSTLKPFVQLAHATGKHRVGVIAAVTLPHGRWRRWAPGAAGSVTTPSAITARGLFPPDLDCDGTSIDLPPDDSWSTDGRGVSVFAPISITWGTATDIKTGIAGPLCLDLNECSVLRPAPI